MQFETNQKQNKQNQTNKQHALTRDHIAEQRCVSFQQKT